MRGLGLMFVASLVAGCKKDKPPAEKLAPVQLPATPVAVDFIVAKPQVADAAIPARFAAPIPHTTAMLAGKGSPFAPTPYIQDSLEGDTNGMRDRLLASVRLAAATGPVDPEIAGWYASLVGYVPSEALCSWLVRVATGKEPENVRAAFWQMAAHCSDTKHALLMTGDEVPDEIVVDAYANLEADAEFNPRVAAAAATLAKKQELHLIDTIGLAFAKMTGPQVQPAFLAIQKTLPADRATMISIGLVRSADPAMREIGQRACKHPSADQRLCTDKAAPRGSTRETTSRPNADLANCARTQSRYEAAECLVELARKDRAGAAAIAKTADRTQDDLYSMVAAALVKYPDAAAIPKYLASVGVTPAPSSNDVNEVTLKQMLMAYGRLDHFDTETGQWPNEHDALLARLAKAATPALDGVVFEEVPPPLGDDVAPYKLIAYSNGKRFELSAANNGDWYDMTAVIGLLNALCIERKSAMRFVVLPTGDQTASVLAAPERAIGQLVADKAIEVEDANAAMKDGKAFEEKAIQRLRETGEIQPGDIVEP